MSLNLLVLFFFRFGITKDVPDLSVLPLKLAKPNPSTVTTPTEKLRQPIVLFKTFLSA